MGQHFQLVGGAVLVVEWSGQGEVAGGGVDGYGTPGRPDTPVVVGTLAQAEKIKIS